MSTKLMSRRDRHSVALRVMALLVVVVALVVGLSRWWVSQMDVAPSAAGTAASASIAPTTGEPALAFAEHQSRAVVEGVGPVGAVRLAAAGEIVTEANGAAWIGSPGHDTVAATTATCAAARALCR